jgi:hypothetical protein
MTADSDIRFLHVANGTSTTMTIEAAGIPGMLSIWADPLHDGPVPGALTDDELLEVRNRHLGGTAGDASSDPNNDLRRWRAAIERVDAYDELVLWYEHDLFDQLNLIQLLTFIRDSAASAKVVSLVCIGSFPGRPSFKGLGELTTAELAPLLGRRQRVSDAQYARAARAWQAFRHSTPDALQALLKTDLTPMPFLRAALERFLQEYPWEHGPLDLAAAFPRMDEGEDAYYVSDTSLVDLVETLSSPSSPLVMCEPAATADRGRMMGVIMLTDAGRAVLQGDVDRVATYGIDRWLGGVHLEGRSAIWRWDDERRQVVAA